jgi:cobalt-zinc-cadmium efflux system membrane fusion protein
MEGHREPMTHMPQTSLRDGHAGRWFLRGLISCGLIAIGAFGSLVLLRSERTFSPPLSSPAAAPDAAQPLPGAEPPAVEAAHDTEVEVVLAPEAVAQAGIKTAEVSVVEPRASTEVPGVVTADAYREVKVTPLVGGIVRKVHAELGTAVKRGKPLAVLFSAELADAQTKYLSMRAMLEADHQRRERTRKLVDIGAASRQELEEVTAVHASHATEVEAARQRLLLLGLSRRQVDALTQPRQVMADVVLPAPIDGVITGRSANLGQVVGMGEELFVVTDLSDVWVVGDLYEQDFPRVRVGSEATITTPAYPELRLQGRVSYIDPRVDRGTRTAKVRVEIPNPNGQLRLGMYMTMVFSTASGAPVVVVPRAAVQTIGGRQVVFVAVPDEEGKFVQRTVKLGPLAGEAYTVLQGLQLGEVVVTEGSFFLRAESLRNAPSG